ncbi:LysR family transcriptional regulator [Shewanella sp. 202IG2-18]|uniref:LysR family transcriptional regulator n=1 Tax=Parashewanella hymeniacidonis TaxID=2807618 RepID=UPI001960532F|nr:LysR family transcriptional regulator [Parashewanella hymeniacidonis]MBM7074330.1 LysR family transcriptional regulator [Parashewanella hymeniacidonis]
MNFKGLKYFISVFETGSFSAASKQCYVAQPSISTAIGNLETELNIQLFLRHGKGVTATEEGLRLYPLAKQLINESQAIKSLFSEKQTRKPFKLGLIRSLGVERMSQLLKDFTQACPHIELTLVEHTEESDARIITTSDLKSHEQFQPIWSDNYLLAIPASSRLSLKSKIGISDLQNQAFIHRQPCEGLAHLQQLLDLEGINLQVRARIQTVEYAMGLVAAGLGIALVPKIEADVNHRDVIFKEIEDIELKRTVGLAVSADTRNLNVIDTLKELCTHY